MAKIERIYNVPLRRAFQRVARNKRAKKAIKTLKEFLIKHMKSEDVKIGPKANETVWSRGIQKPPHHIKVKVIKENEIVIAEIPEFFDDFYAYLNKKSEKTQEEKETKKEEISKEIKKEETNENKLKEEVEKAEEKIENMKEKVTVKQ